MCPHGKTTATTDAVITGDFDSGYKERHEDPRYTPPMHGMSEMKMTQEARGSAPCKPGQRPGDIMMPNMGARDEHAGHDERPKIQEMMMRQQRRGGAY